MSYELMFIFMFLCSTITAKEHRIPGCRYSKIPPFLKLKQGSLPVPGPSDTPLTVKISAEIVGVTLDEEKQEFEASLYFRQEWNDPHLTFRMKATEEFRFIKDPDSIWMPGLFIVNGVTTNPNGKDTRYIKHYPDGRVFTEEKKRVRASCTTNLRMYPFDTQTCLLQIESFGHTVDDIIVEWNNTNGKPAVTEKLLAHDFVTSVASITDVTRFRGTEYSSPRIIFHLSRTPTAIILRVMLPIAVIAASSWISFFFIRDEVGVRISLCVSPIMTYLLQINFCVAFFISPRYLTGLDVWAVTSFAAMMVSAFECVCMVFRKKPQDSLGQGNHKSDFKNRVAIALLVIILDILSIISVFLSRLL